MSDAGTDIDDDTDSDVDPEQADSPTRTTPVPESDVDDVPTEGETPDDAAVGVKQRLRLQVPDVYTQVTLGEAISNGDDDGFSYPGFGVQTAGHVFLSAGAAGRDPEKNQFMMLQAKSGVSALSPDGAVFVAGGAGVNVASGGSVTMGGEGGVLIAGGTGVGTLSDDFKTEFDGRKTAHADPTPPDWAVTQGRTVAGIATLINTFDLALAGANDRYRTQRRDALHPSIDPSEGFKARWASRADRAGAFLSSVGSALDTCGESWPTFGPLSTAWLNRLSSSAVIFGQSGTIVSSPLSVAVYAGHAGVVVGSKGCIDLLSDDSLHAHSGNAVSVSGAAVSVLSSGAAEMLSANECTIASREDAVVVLGKEVHLGSMKTASGQASTELTTMRGKSVVAVAQEKAILCAGKELALTSSEAIDARSKTLAFAAKESFNAIGNTITLGASKQSKLSVGNSAIVLEKQQLTIGWSDADFVRPTWEDVAEEAELRLKLMHDRLMSHPVVARATEEAVGPRLHELEGKFEKVRSGGVHNALVFKKSGIDLVYEGVKFSISRGKAKLANHLVVTK
jgi:hypothetical protein